MMHRLLDNTSANIHHVLIKLWLDSGEIEVENPRLVWSWMKEGTRATHQHYRLTPLKLRLFDVGAASL